MNEAYCTHYIKTHAYNEKHAQFEIDSNITDMYHGNLKFIE